MSQWHVPPGGPAGGPTPYSDAPSQEPTTQVLIGPDTRTRINPWVLVMFAAVVLCVSVAALVVVLTSGGGDTTDRQKVAARQDLTTTTVGPVTTQTAPAPTTSLPPVTTAPPPPPTVPPPTVPPTTSPRPQVMSEADALVALSDQVSSDASAVEQLVGLWVPQISAKKPGLDVPDDDRGTYTAAMVLSDHLAYRQRYASDGVLLLRSADFNFKIQGFLVTVVDRPFQTAEEANAWCEGNGIGVKDCFAKQLVHGPYVTGTVRPRG